MCIISIRQTKNSEFLAHPAFSVSTKLQNRQASVVSISAPGMCTLSVRHTWYLAHSRMDMCRSLIRTRHSPDPSKSWKGINHHLFIFHNYYYTWHSHYPAFSISGIFQIRHTRHSHYPAHSGHGMSPGMSSSPRGIYCRNQQPLLGQWMTGNVLFLIWYSIRGFTGPRESYLSVHCMHSLNRMIRYTVVSLPGVGIENPHKLIYRML